VRGCSERGVAVGEAGIAGPIPTSCWCVKVPSGKASQLEGVMYMSYSKISKEMSSLYLGVMYSGNPMFGFSKPSIAASDTNSIAWIATD
jgi:hypothetical protein